MSSFTTAPTSLPTNNTLEHTSEHHARVEEVWIPAAHGLELTPLPGPQSCRPRNHSIVSRKSSARSMVRSVHPPPPSPVATYTEKSAEGRGSDFWLVFLALCSSTLLEALDFTTVSTALPTIGIDLKDAEKSTWIGAAYTLSSTAFQPLVGALADVLGRKPCILGSLILFAIGSTLCGGARDMSMLIVGRTVQGVGAAGIGSLSDIILADLVPLKERGTFAGILAAVWAVASAIGPTIGGVFAEQVSWRWLFYINLPLTALALVMVFLFLKLKTPTDNILFKLSRVDWLGNIIIIAGTTAVVIALTWGGVKYPWRSYQVLVPLIGGLLSIGGFFCYEKRWAENPSVPFELLSDMTSLSGYLGTFFHGIMATALVYYLPLYFQAVKSHSPTKSGIDMLEISLTIAPVAIVSGASVAVFNKYRIQNYLGWILSTVGFGLLSLTDADTTGAKLVGLQITVAIGVGIIYGSVTFPILAPLGVSENAHALAFHIFLRTFSYTFGIAIGSSILQNALTRRLPVEFLALFPRHQGIAYAAVGIIPTIPIDQQHIIKAHFASSISMIWKVLVGVAGAGLLSCFLMKEIPMSGDVDEQWQLEAAAKTLPDPIPADPSHKAVVHPQDPMK